MVAATTNNSSSMNSSITSFGWNLVSMAFLGCLLLTTIGVGIRVNFAYAQQQQEDPNSLAGTYSKGYDTVHIKLEEHIIQAVQQDIHLHIVLDTIQDMIGNGHS
jgi:hypothetical protein